MSADLIVDIRSYRVCSTDRLLPDTNAWLAYAGFCSGPSDRDRMRPYARLISEAIRVHATILQAAPVFTEFFNVWVGSAWRNSADCDADRPGAQKAFRRTDAYRVSADEASAHLRQIGLDSRWAEVSPTHGKAALTTIGSGVRGIVDQILVEICREHGATLVTDDGDFAGCAVPVLTANRRLLNQNEW